MFSDIHSISLLLWDALDTYLHITCIWNIYSQLFIFHISRLYSLVGGIYNADNYSKSASINILFGSCYLCGHACLQVKIMQTNRTPYFFPRLVAECNFPTSANRTSQCRRFCAMTPLHSNAEPPLGGVWDGESEFLRFPHHGFSKPLRLLSQFDHRNFFST